MSSLFEPSDEHRQLRDMLRSFAETKVEPQAAEHDRDEKFNLGLFRELGELGLLGITVDEEYGGAGMGPVATRSRPASPTKSSPRWTRASPSPTWRTRCSAPTT